MAEMDARVPLRSDTRDSLRRLKRGQETYDALFCRMIEQYEPPEPEEVTH